MPFDHELWERLRRDQLGVDVIDPLGHQIGMARGINHRWYTWGLDWRERQVNWTPVDGMKHVLVGEFDSFDTSDAAGGREWDWEIRIFPDPAFRFILDQVVAMMSADERADLVPRERGPGPCVECEVTPDEDEDFRSAFSAPWSPQPGQKIGVYGPWVRDFGHNGRPEIHPCEAIWWMGEPRHGVETSRLVAVVQDASARHDWPCDFDGPVPRPWSAYPRTAKITFALRPRVQEHMQFSLRFLSYRELASIADPGVTSLTGEFGGQPVISVTQLTDDPSHVSMDLSPVAPDPDGVHLRCFLTIAVQVSDADRGRAGHVLLNLETLEPGRQRPRGPEPVKENKHPDLAPGK
jgi:hypothetical protein